ncbi:hypothetical protein J6590_097100 [Homalodisca vitripennis]|nr:hypothetical protein J6590_097100 [Homalodisca vitripennis]
MTFQLNLGNLMDVQGRHITDRQYRDIGVQRIMLRAIASLDIRACHLLLYLTREPGAELGSPSSRVTTFALPSVWSDKIFRYGKFGGFSGQGWHSLMSRLATAFNAQSNSHPPQ